MAVASLFFKSIAEERRRKRDSLRVSSEAAEKDFRSLLGEHRRDEAVIKEALEFARTLDFGKSPLKANYMTHPLRVASFLLRLEPGIDADMLVVALLHNVIEVAGEASAQRLKERFGAKVEGTVRALTVDRKAPFESIEEAYYARLNALGRDTMLVKLLDKMDNLFVLCLNPDAEVRRKYLDEIDRRLVPFAQSYKAELGDYLKRLVHDARVTGHLKEEDIG